HPRNKETRQLRAVADRGGLVGVTMFPPFLPRGFASTVDDYAGIIEWMVDHCGEDHVAYGTDFTQGHGTPFFEWITRDKGYARQLTRFGEIKNPKDIERIEDTPNLTAALRGRQRLGRCRAALDRHRVASCVRWAREGHAVLPELSPLLGEDGIVRRRPRPRSVADGDLHPLASPARPGRGAGHVDGACV